MIIEDGPRGLPVAAAFGMLAAPARGLFLTPKNPSMNQPTDSEIAHDVLRTIRQIMRRVAEHSRYLSTEVGLTLPQLMCLKAVGELEEEAVSEITVANVAELGEDG
jgi:hypothetical protein